MKICLTTACAPWLPIADLIPQLAAAGYQGVEIAYNAGNWQPDQAPNCWSNNAAIFDLSRPLPEQLAEARDLRVLAQAHGLDIPCLGNYVLTSDRDGLGKALQVAAALGASMMRVRVPWFDGNNDYQFLLHEARATYQWLATQAEETGVKALIEIHNNSICPTASAAMRILESLDPNHVGVIFDPGNYAMEGLEHLPMAVQILGPYLHHVHVKNGTVAAADKTNHLGVRLEGHFVPLSEGIIDWPRLAENLQAAGYDGWFSVENFNGVDLGPQRLMHDYSVLREALSSSYN